MIEGTEEQYEEISERAYRKYRKSQIGAANQTIHPSDNLEWWIFKETIEYINEKDK